MGIEEKVEGLPHSPGVYLMRGKAGEVLYIGKAKDLRARVRSYFQEARDERYTIQFLLSKVADIDYIVTDNEKEALILEDTLLKRYKPRYNIRLKDDKTYVSIKLTAQEDFPRISVTRKTPRDGSLYLGPYASANKARETLRFLRRIFPLCTCSLAEFRGRVRPCLDYQMNICSAPCVGLISKEAYRELVDGAIMFLEGRSQALVRELTRSMEMASRDLDFERAALLRDRIRAIEVTLERQKVVSPEGIDQDIFAYIQEGDEILIQVLYVREGRLTGGKEYLFKRQQGLPLEEALSSFLVQYYSKGVFIPEEIILPIPIEDKVVMEDWLGERKGQSFGEGLRVRLFFPKGGDRYRLLQMAEKNAQEALRRLQALGRGTALEEVKERLRLKRLPKVIEAFDISNIGGRLAVGAMVIFEDGKPNKDRYRRFKIETLQTPDDYGMMSEVLSRRYTREEWKLPDLILLDGGKGQLNIALKVLEGLGIKDVDIVALAKERLEERRGRRRLKGERVYIPNVKDPIVLKEGSPPDLLLRRVRDEVHRFAIAYHKRLRKMGVRSILLDIPGIGEKRARALLTHFGSVERIKGASTEELLTIPGMTRKVAEKVKEALR